MRASQQVDFAQQSTPQDARRQKRNIEAAALSFALCSANRNNKPNGFWQVELELGVLDPQDKVGQMCRLTLFRVRAQVAAAWWK